MKHHNNRTTYARTLDEAFPNTPAAAQWLEAPEAVSLRVSIVLGIMVFIGGVVALVGAIWLN